MKKLLVILSVTLFPISLMAQDLEGVKCIMRTKADVKESTGVEFNGGIVYFCCGNCAAKFQEDPEEYTALANWQMFSSGQYTQKACPLTGRDMGEDVTSEVGEVVVGLCCNNCKKKLDNAEGLAAKAAIAFSKEAFEKGFEPAREIDLAGVTCLVMDDHEVAADSFVEHNGGKVFFCCDDCIEAFNEEPEKFAAMANRQLVQTGQFVQTACPFSGRPTADGKTVKIGETEVSFCCDNCKGKVEGAEDDSARTEMVFNAAAFEKGFAAREKDEETENN